MLEKDWIDRQLLDISTVEEAQAVLQQLEEQMLIMLKRIRIQLVDLGDTLRSKLRMELKALSKTVRSSFQIHSVEDYLQGTALYGSALAGSLYQLQRELSGMEVAVIRAVAPLVQLLVPALRAAVSVATGLVGALGQVISTLFLGTKEADSYADAVNGAAAAGSTLQRSLAGFDQLNRLGKQSGTGIFSTTALQPLPGIWKDLADSILQYLEPLRKLDLTPAAQALERLKKALAPITKELFAGLEWAWHNLLLPLAKWTAEELLPVFLDTLRAGLSALGRVIDELKPTFTWLWENFLQPLAAWAGDQVIGYLRGIADELNGVTTQAGQSQNVVYMMINSGNLLAKTIADLVSETLFWSNASDNANTALGRLFSSMMGSGTPLGSTVNSVSSLVGILGQLAQAFGLVDSSSNSVWDGMKAIWSGAWQWLKGQLVDPAYSGVRATINSVIGFINTMLQGAAEAINFLSRSISQIGFEIPAWVPIVGGKGVHFQLGTVQAPQIPYLAKGAVLPANQPFMAVVGDQKHGTNIEAPLTTIQEAVALVMEDYAQSNLAGHEATVAVLREILEAVLGIELGEATLSAAVDSYNQKLAVMRGG